MASTKTLQVPVVPGMREDLSPHVAPVGTLLNATNVRCTTEGEIEARRGTTALSASTSADVAYKDLLGSNGPDFLQGVPGGFVFGIAGYSYRFDFGKLRVHPAGSYSNALPYGRFAAIASESTSYTLGNSMPWPLSVAVGGGYIVICWSSGNGQQSIGATTNGVTRIQVYTEGGTRVGSYTSTHLAACVIYDATAGKFILVAQQSTALGSSTALEAATITPAQTGITISAFSSVGTLNASNSCWAACPWPGIGWALVYQSAGTTVTAKKMAALATTTTNTFTSSGTAPPLSVYASTTQLYIGWVAVNSGGNCVANAESWDVAMAVRTSTTVYTDNGQTTLTLTPPLFGTCASATTVFCVVGRATDLGGAATATTFTKAFTLTDTGTLATVSDVPAYNMMPVSGPFNNGMVWCRYRTPNSVSYANNYARHVLLDFPGARAIAYDQYYSLRQARIALTGEAFADPAGAQYLGGIGFLHMFTPQALSNGHWIAGIPRLVRSEESQGGIGEGLAIGEWLEFDTNCPREARQMGAEVVVAGSPALVSPTGTNGTVSDATFTSGQLGIDLGFVGESAVATPSQSNSADGALTALGAYQYRCVVEWIDGQGRRWRSRPSRVLAVTMTGVNDTNTFTDGDDFAWLRQSGNYSSPLVKHYYRTVSGGSTFYRCSRPQGVSLAGAGATFVDIISDLQLQTREILYTDGGVLGNDHPPSCRFVAVTEDRLWFGGLWDETQLQSSKTLVPGEPPQFSDSPAFRVVLPDKCTGLAAQDGVLVAFCRQGIYAIQGGGPNDQGQGAWDSPRVITRSTGCINNLSILETSQGIFFQSNRGIELLPRGGGEPVFIGAGIQDTLAGYSVTFCSVVSTERAQTARFCLSSTGATMVLVYDLLGGGWSVDDHSYNLAGITDSDQGAIIALQTLTSDDYGFLLEAPTATTDLTGSADGPYQIDTTLEWSTLHPFGVAGWGKLTSAVALLDEITADSSPGYQTGNCALFMTVWGQPGTQSETGKQFQMSGFSGPQILRHTPQQVIGSFADLKFTSAVNGWRFIGWTIELEQQEGGARTPETDQG